MQYADYTAARTSAAAERDRLVEMGFLSELEGTAVDLMKINTFFQSGLAQRSSRAAIGGIACASLPCRWIFENRIQF